jgi:hypothetical protein
MLDHTQPDEKTPQSIPLSSPLLSSPLLSTPTLTSPIPLPCPASLHSAADLPTAHAPTQALPQALYKTLPEEEKPRFKQMCSDFKQGGPVAVVSGGLGFRVWISSECAPHARKGGGLQVW